MVLSACASMPTMKSVAGTYEGKESPNGVRLVFLDNGIFETYKNGKKDEVEHKWSISKEGELHVTYSDVGIVACRINKDGSITEITRTSIEGERVVIPKNYQTTYKKIK